MGDADSDARRHSLAAAAELITNPQLKAEAEAANGLRQYDLAVRMAQEAIERGGRFRLRVSHVLALHREALAGVSNFAGNFRPAGVEIQGSSHKPVGAHLVPENVEELCDYVNDNWEAATALHLASYVMWRLNWIHPFDDGNGRTSRTLSFLVLCVKAEDVLGGTPTIPDQIVQNRNPYFAALDAADAAWKQGQIDVTVMEELLESLLARQLRNLFEKAGGRVRE